MSVVHISASKKRKQRLHMAQATGLKYFRVIDGNTISFVFQSISRAEHNYWHCALAEMTIMQALRPHCLLEGIAHPKMSECCN